MATWEDIQLEIQAIADARDDIAAYSLRTPGEAIEVYRNVEIVPGEAWGQFKPFQIYLEGIAEYLENQGVSGAVQGKINELIGEFNQFLADYNNSVWPSTASSVTPLP